ncbi:hypothetical protein [Phormidium sp. FACHB-1136]|uniref:hypothetical protein n=1 Tax=Phormidium sp. FACHB-1136 TaxID=2692848 RepID=UPI0016892064|nr:hypothetical protein [Phormidium sp. FACHB-1136]MBD2425257.1 hypothetical protein [Phormidium sp. FACHB-1136]
MQRNPRKQILAALAAVALGLAVLAAGSRDEFPGRRQGGGSRGEFPAGMNHGT